VGTSITFQCMHVFGSSCGFSGTSSRVMPPLLRVCRSIWSFWNSLLIASAFFSFRRMVSFALVSLEGLPLWPQCPPLIVQFGHRVRIRELQSYRSTISFTCRCAHLRAVEQSSMVAGISTVSLSLDISVQEFPHDRLLSSSL
jgi:hypothetical protein